MSSTWKATQVDVVRNLSLAGTALIANRLVGAREEHNLPAQPFQTSAASLSHGPDNAADVFEGFEEFDGGFTDFDGEFEDFDEKFKDFDEGTEMDLDEFGADFDDTFESFDNFDEELDDFPLFDGPTDIPSVPPVRQDPEELEGEEGDEENGAADLVIGGILIALAEHISALRGPYNQIMKSKDWFEVSMKWPPTWFRRVYRMSLQTFRRVTAILSERPIFQQRTGRPQRPVAHQLACFLIRFGSNGAVGFDAAAELSLGVGTVYLYCARVTRALREVGLECVAWPNEERKNEIKYAFEELSGIPGCIGAGDGTLVVLMSKPREEGNEYVSYKGSISVNLFCVVDHRKRFISHEGGWAGCKNDKTTFRSSRVWQCRGVLIQRGERLLVDKGFFTSPYTCRPYSKREVDTGTAQEKKQKRSFNSRFSKARVLVEHAFGMLKSRFPSTRFMSTAIDIQTTHRVLEALLALHNLCIDYEDSPNDDGDSHDNELEEILHQFPGHMDVGVGLREGGWDGRESEPWLLREGNQLREELREISQQWADARD